ncbi:unnamed protein product [Cylindrotheca closterium]|uniref:Uncharacterized protein n=1 Tax=Cylindrotheca closterium TaxID=2856 RepID=A0AAD2CD04_9STRA|nr:unnamed protein product [Cylindrotheca closterium]
MEYSPIDRSPTSAPTPQPTPFRLTPVTPRPTQGDRAPNPYPTRATAAPTPSPSPPPTQTSPAPTPPPTAWVNPIVTPRPSAKLPQTSPPTTPPTASQVVMSNDHCIHALNIVSLPFSMADTTAGSTPDFAVKTCGVVSEASGVWYTYTPTETRSIRVFVDKTSGSARSYLRVFYGDDCDALICRMYSGGFSSRDSSATFVGQAGVTYKFLVSPGSGGSSFLSEYNITVQDYDLEHDKFDDARNIASLPYQRADTTVGAVPDFDIETCGVDKSAGGVWYTCTPSETRTIRVYVERTSGTSINTRSHLRVFSGNEFGTLRCLRHDGGYNSGDSAATFVGQAGVTYKFLVSTASYTLGISSYTITVKDYDLENDGFDDARNITSLPYQRADTTVGAVPDFGIDTCGVDSSAGGVWYTYTPSETRSIRVYVERTSGTSVNTKSHLRVFSGNEFGTLRCLRHDGGVKSGDSAATFVGQAGVTYKFLVSTAFYTLGIPSYTITVRDYDLENDACDDARNIASLPYQRVDTTIGALPDFDNDSCGVDESAGGVWYTYTPTETRKIRVFVERTSGTLYSNRSYLRVFSGNECGTTLTCLTHDGGYYSGDSAATFVAQSGVTYKFLVSTGVYGLGIPSYTISVGEQQ